MFLWQAFFVFLAVQRSGCVLPCSVGIRPIKPHLHCCIQEENHQTGRNRRRQVKHFFLPSVSTPLVINFNYLYYITLRNRRPCNECKWWAIKIQSGWKAFVHQCSLSFCIGLGISRIWLIHICKCHYKMALCYHLHSWSKWRAVHSIFSASNSWSHVTLYTNDPSEFHAVWSGDFKFESYRIGKWYWQISWVEVEKVRSMNPFMPTYYFILYFLFCCCWTARHLQS